MSEKTKILFIKPYTVTPGNAIDVPLGVLYLSSYLKKFLGDSIETSFVDLRREKKGGKVLEKRLEEFKPDIIGISLLTFEKDFLQENLEFLKQKAPYAMIIIGGPYATYSYDIALKDSRIDCAVVGEGERVLLNIVRNYIDGKDYRNIKGVAYLDGEEVICNEKEDFIEDMDTLPFPDYDMIDISKYWGYHQNMNVLLSEKRYVPIMSSRACPYKCIYCHNIFGRSCVNEALSISWRR